MPQWGFLADCMFSQWKCHLQTQVPENGVDRGAHGQGCGPLAGVLLCWGKSSWPLCRRVCMLIGLLCLACSSCANPDLQRHGYDPVDEGHRLAVQSCGGPCACGEVDERQVTSNPMCAFSGALRHCTRDTELGPVRAAKPTHSSQIERRVGEGPGLQHWKELINYVNLP